MIKFQNVTKKYGDGAPVLDDVNFLIEKGEFVYLVGPTGSGKTTIFRLIIRDLLPTDGQISIGEWDIASLPKSKVSLLRRKVAVVFQDLKLLMDRTVVENVMLPLELSGVNESDARQRADEILIDVGLDGKQEKFPLQLSGGERQRVAIARALIFDPEIILADEPTGNLDSGTSFQILNLLKSINHRGTTVFMATHNDKIIEKSDERIIIIDKGKLVDDKKSKNKPVIIESDASVSKDDKKVDKDEKEGPQRPEASEVRKKPVKTDKKEKEEKHEEKKGKIKLEDLSKGKEDES